jgi:hypothetical protein
LKLIEWYTAIPTLYLPQFCLLNEHMVGKHLWLCCQNYGPLASHNCFSFESFYGYLVRLKSGSTPYSSKMMFTVGYHQALQCAASKSGICNDIWQGKLMEKVGVPIQIVQNKYVYLYLI